MEETLRNSFNDQLQRMGEKVDTLIKENAVLKHEMKEIQTAMEFNNSAEQEKEIKLRSKFEEKDENEKRLVKKISELEDRNRRNNLRFENINEEKDETWEKSEVKLKKILKDKLGIENVEIERAHRTGPRVDIEGKKKNRTIVAKFLNYKDRENILQEYKKQKLWKDKLYVNEDFSVETAKLRMKLLKKVKELKEEGIQAKVVYNKIIYFDYDSRDQKR